MGRWSGITTAQGSDRGEYLPPGTYDAEVVYTDSFEKRNGGGFLAKVRLAILASNNEVKVGAEQDMCFNIDPSRKDVYPLQLADVRGYVMAAEECPQNEVTEEATEYIFTRKNDAHVGKRVRVVATNISTKSGDPFTKYVCKPFNEAAHVQLKGSRAA